LSKPASYLFIDLVKSIYSISSSKSISSEKVYEMSKDVFVLIMLKSHLSGNYTSVDL